MPKLIISETNLDGKLKELAVENWEEFIHLIGQDALILAKVCHLKNKKKSYSQIATKLHISKKQARLRCKKCPAQTGHSL